MQTLPLSNYLNFHISLANIVGNVPIALPSLSKNGSSNENSTRDQKITTTDMGVKLNAVSSQAKLLLLQYHYPYSISELIRHCIEICYVASHHKLSYSRFGDQDIEEVKNYFE